MSFEDVARGNGRERELRPYSPTDSSTKAVKDVVGAVFKIQTEVSRVKRDVEKLGGPRDTAELRQRIGAANHSVTSAAKRVKARLLELGASGLDAKQIAKLTTDFEATLKDFQTTMRIARSKEAASLPRAAPQQQLQVGSRGDAASEQESQALLSAQLQAQEQSQVAQLEPQVAYNEALIEERDQGIQEIQQQIAEVNEIFQDLAVLVHDQGSMVDDIESNIAATAESTRTAAREVVRAERYQRSNRNRKCFLLLIAAAVLGVLLLVLLGT